MVAVRPMAESGGAGLQVTGDNNEHCEQTHVLTPRLPGTH